MDNEWINRPFQPSALPPDYFHKPSPARMWNYLQGGDDHFALDRTAGDALAAAFPDIFYLAKQARRFLMRALRHVAGEGNVHQFLDLGCGLPAPIDMSNVHEVVQEIRPDARVVYVDSDKVVISHVDALLRSKTPEGKTAYIEADIHDSAAILAEAGETLDLTKPVGVLMLGILGHIADFDEACAVVDEFMAAVPTGSYLVVQDGFDDHHGVREGVEQRNKTGIQPYHLRTLDQFQRYFRALELVEPGIVAITNWRPEAREIGVVRPVASYGIVARKARARLGS